MRLLFNTHFPIVLLAGLAPAAARAQDNFAIQTMVEQSLFEVRGRIERNDAAVRRRVEARAQAQQLRAERQDEMLRAQAAAVQQLAGELQMLRDERTLLQLAEAFDAALVARDQRLVRSLLADVVTVGARTVPAETLVAEIAAATAKPPADGLRRTSARVRIDGDRAFVTSTGGDPGIGRELGAGGDLRTAGAANAVNTTGRPSSEREYRFVRSAGTWTIDGIDVLPR